jgi:hypothetical protein
MDKRIATLKITIDGTSYYYEAHSMQKVAEILSSQISTLVKFNAEQNKNSYIEDFEVLYFAEVE